MFDARCRCPVEQRTPAGRSGEQQDAIPIAYEMQYMLRAERQAPHGFQDAPWAPRGKGQAGQAASPEPPNRSGEQSQDRRYRCHLL